MIGSGSRNVAVWLDRLGIQAQPAHWYVGVLIDADVLGTRIDINVCEQEWGFVFMHAGGVSSIRAVDAAFVYGVDEFHLHAHAPTLEHIPTLLATLERRFAFEFLRSASRIRTNVGGASDVIRKWLVARR